MLIHCHGHRNYAGRALSSRCLHENHLTRDKPSRATLGMLIDLMNWQGCSLECDQEQLQVLSHHTRWFFYNIILAMSSETSISSYGRSCCTLFERLCTIWPSVDSAITDQISLDAIKTEGSRYDLWANNIAALQDPYLPSSLEYRIREDANARGIIKKALAYLEESLQLGRQSLSSICHFHQII